MSTADFYDRLSPFYHLIYPDWDRSIERQSAALDTIIGQNWPDGGVKTILDATCGIGTQAIGLARRGYHVTGSDLSSRSVERARYEAAQRGLDIRFTCCDVRELSQLHCGGYDLVISCDNSLPHLLGDDDLRIALREMHACTRPGGGCLVSVRDYAAEKLEGVQVKPYGVRDADGKRYLAFQIWDCADRTYDVTMYLIEDAGGQECRTHVMRSKYYAVSIDRLLELMREAGFDQAQRINDMYFQPVLVATRPKPAI
jgi:SAM-dependent methyltransferase